MRLKTSQGEQQAKHIQAFGSVPSALNRRVLGDRPKARL
jgi:hypothetical protein